MGGEAWTPNEETEGVGTPAARSRGAFKVLGPKPTKLVVISKDLNVGERAQNITIG